MKKYLKVLLPLVLVLALAMALSVVAFADTSANEAKIGNTEYATLEEAVTAANAGDTVVLIKDINRAVTSIAPTKSISLDMNGHEMNVTAPSDISTPLFHVGTNNVTFTLKGEGTINVAQVFMQLDSNKTGTKLVIAGTDSGIVINSTAAKAAMILNSGLGADVTNAHFYMSGDYNPFFMISSGTLAFEDSTVVASHANSRLFSYKKAGTAFTFKNTYAKAGKSIFLGDAYHDTDDSKKLDNPADFVMLDAKDSVFHALDVANTPFIMNFGGGGKIRISGTMNFDNCELASYRIFEIGANSGVSGLNGGELEDGYTLNINCTNSNINVLSHTNSGQILRGLVNYRFEDCNLGILANGGIGGYTDGNYITVVNCHFGRDPRSDTSMKNYLLVNSPKDGSGNLAVYYDVTNPEYPFYLCEESKKPTVQPDSILFHNYNMNTKNANPAFPLIGVDGPTDTTLNNLTYGGNYSIKWGRLEPVSDISGSYVKYTITDLDGTIPQTPKTVKSTTDDPYIILGDDSKPNLVPLKDKEIVVIDFDIKLDNFGVSNFSVAPQLRTESGSGASSDSFGIQSNTIDGKNYYYDSEWHHLQIVITVKQTAKDGYNIYDGSTYQLYVDGTPVGNANRFAVKDNSGLTAELFLQGVRINIKRNTNHTTGASASFDNILLHTYKDADSFTPGILPANGNNLIAGDRYSSISLEGENLNVVTDRTVTADDLAVSLKSGIRKDGVIYGDFKGIITDRSALSSGLVIGESIFVHNINGNTSSFYATYANNASGIVVYDKEGNAYMAADNSAEFKTLFESMKDGETAKLIAEEFTVEGVTAYLNSTTAKTLNFDLAGKTLSKVRKGQIFSHLQNITLNIYSSIPGGLIDGRGRFDNSVNPSDAYYKFNVNFGAAMLYVNKPNATVNLGAYGDFPGSNLTVTGAYMIEVVSNTSGAEVNIDGGTYIRTVRDSVGFIGARGNTDALITISNANLLSGESNPAPLFHIEGTSTLTVNDSTVFMPMPTEAGATAKPLFNALATTATASFTNTSFSNVSFTPANASMAGKSVLNAGCTISATCNITNADLGDCFAATLPEGWKQTLADGSTQLSYNAVSGTGSATYHFYKEAPGNDNNKFAFIWTGGTATDGNGNTVPAGSFTVIYGDIATVCSGDATSGYTLKKDSYTYKSLTGNTGEKITETYIVTAGETVPQGTPYREMPDQAYIILAEGQRVVTWVINDSSVTEIRDAGDNTVPEGFELPSSVEGVYSYTYTLSTETENGVSYETYTSEFKITLKLLSNISLNDSFKYNVYIPKALVDAGYVAKSITLNGDETELNNVYLDGSVEYYIVSVDDIAATNGGDSFTVSVTVNLEDDAIEATATKTPSYTFSIPAYAQLVLDTPNGTSGVNAECKQMMADVLNYIKLAAIFGGSNYTSKAGYAAVLEVIQAYADADIAPTDTSATDFAAIAKTPSIEGVGDAVSGVTFVIGSSVKVRFYLAEMYDGNLTLTYKDKSGADVSETFAIEDGKYGNNDYVELTLKAYYVAGDITVTFEGQTDATDAVYNLASYIEYYKNDAKVADLAKALYAYANAALAYQNTLN